MENYYGQQTEILNGLTITDDVVEKPLELIRYEMVKELHLPVWDGGLMDQPHIWLLQYKIVNTVATFFENMRRANEEAKRQRSANNATSTQS